MSTVEVSDLNFNLRRRLGQIVGGIADWAIARLSTRSAPRPAPTLDGATGLIGAIMRAGQAVRSAPTPPRNVKGVGWQFDGYSPKQWLDAKLDRELRGPEVWYGRISSGFGPTPAAWVPDPEVTLRYIANVQAKAERTGWMDEKAALDSRVLKFDPHFGSVDRIRRSPTFRAPFVIEPMTPTPLDQLCANFLRAAVDQIDGFMSSCSELDTANGTGCSMSELIWRRKKLPVMVGPNQTTTIDVNTVASIHPVPTRSIVFDVMKDRPYLCAGPMPNLDPFFDDDGNHRRKFLYHIGYGDFDARSRGYMFAGHYLYYLSGLSLERWSIVLETYGCSTPFAEYPLDMHGGAQALADVDNALADLGKGRPTKIPAGWKISNTETPQGLVPLHQAILGFLDAQKSKLVVSNTLTQEMGGVGSYNAMTGHQDQQEATQVIDAALRAESLRTQLFRDLLEVNAEALARAFSPFVPGGCSPDDIRARSARCRWDIRRELGPDQRLKMFIDAADKGENIAREQVYRECGFRPAQSTADAFGRQATQEPTATPSPATPTAPEETQAGDGNAPPPA